VLKASRNGLVSTVESRNKLTDYTSYNEVAQELFTDARVSGFEGFCYVTFLMVERFHSLTIDWERQVRSISLGVGLAQNYIYQSGKDDD